MENEPESLNNENAHEQLYKRPYLAFLDILGFSTLVKENSHETLVELYDDIFSKTVQRVDEMMEKLKASKVKEHGEKYIDSGLRIINISDSIIIWTKHGNPNALFEIVAATSALMGFSLIRGLPLRGSITRQPFAVKEKGTVTSIIGKGLVHAYNVEKNQQWSGCTIDSEIINYFRSIEKLILNRNRPSPIERNYLVYEYDIPIKDKENSSATKRGFAVNWSDRHITDTMILNSFEEHNKKDESEETKYKIEKTIEFHNFCQSELKEREDKEQKLIEAFKEMDNNEKDKYLN